MSELQRFTSLHYKILSLAFLELSMKEISEKTGVDYGVVRSVVNSDIGKEILAGMSQQEQKQLVPDLQKEFGALLVKKKDLPMQMINGYVEQPQFNEDGEFTGTVPRVIDPELRLKAFKTVAELAGAVTDKQHGNTLVIMTGDRLRRVKESARKAGALAEDIEYEEVKENA